MVRFQNVGLRYGLGPEVLRDVSFHLKPGSFHFLTGPSGAGKTSLLKIMYLALQPTRGLISLFGQDLSTIPRKQLPPMRRRIGVVFQNFRLMDHLSAVDNVALPLKIAGAKRHEVEAHVADERAVQLSLDLTNQRHRPVALLLDEHRVLASQNSEHPCSPQ